MKSLATYLTCVRGGAIACGTAALPKVLAIYPIWQKHSIRSADDVSMDFTKQFYERFIMHAKVN